MHPAWLDRAAYPFATRRVAVAGGSLNVVDEGTGPPLLLSHGTPTWSFEYRHVITALRTERRCVAPDHLGFGLSDRPKDADYRPEAHAARFAQAADAVLGDAVGDSAKVTVLLHDFGGPMALPWVFQNLHRVERLVFVNTWCWSFAADPQMDKRARQVEGALGRFLYRHLNASLRLVMPSAYGDRKKLTPAIHAQYLRVFDDKDARERVLFALARALRGSSAFYDGLWQRRAELLAVPTHILWGERDSAFGPAVREKLQEALPHAAVTTFQEAGHWPHEEQPAAFIASLRAALSSPVSSAVASSGPR
jgi:haloalkane dehalogenase